MTLRTRLLLGCFLVAVVTIAGSFLVASNQEEYVRNKTDERLQRLLPVAKTTLRRIDLQDKAPRVLEQVVAEAWIGRVDAGQKLITVIAPTTDPGLMPDYPADEISAQPSTVETISGDTQKVRIITAYEFGRPYVVVALPLDDQEAMFSNLEQILYGLVAVVILLLFVMGYWVYRLGIFPLLEMARSARRISHGDRGHRVRLETGDNEARELAVSLNEMLDELSESDQRIRRFIADVSHELRTPLTTIKGYSEMFESGMLKSSIEISSAMERIKSESTRMARIIDDLLQLRQIEDIELKLQSTSIDLLCQKCVDDLLVSYPSRDIKCRAEDSTALVDEELITQAVMAYGVNAVDHTPEKTRIEVRVIDEADHIRIEVSDDGPGIDPVHHPHVFERLFRVDTSRNGTTRHTGIGLSLVASIVSAHGGTFGVESQVGQGTCFWMEIPKSPTDDE